MFPRDPAAVAALRALLRADDWHAARAALRQAEAEGQPLEPVEPDPKHRPACDPPATPLTPGRSGPGPRRVAWSLGRRSRPFRRIDDTTHGPVTTRGSPESARAVPGKHGGRRRPAR